MISILFLAQSVVPLTAIPDKPFEPELITAVKAALESNENVLDDALIVRLDRLANEGDDSALELLGEVYGLGLYGVERDLARALYRKARETARQMIETSRRLIDAAG